MLSGHVYALRLLSLEHRTLALLLCLGSNERNNGTACVVCDADCSAATVLHCGKQHWLISVAVIAALLPCCSTSSTQSDFAAVVAMLLPFFNDVVPDRGNWLLAACSPSSY